MAKKNKTFASEAKKIMAKYKKRLGENLDGHDKYAQEALKLELEQLKQEQEKLREEKGLNQSSNENFLPAMSVAGTNAKLENGGTLPKKKGDQIGTQYIYPTDSLTFPKSGNSINSLNLSNQSPEEISKNLRTNNNYFPEIEDRWMKTSPVPASSQRIINPGISGIHVDNYNQEENNIKSDEINNEEKPSIYESSPWASIASLGANVVGNAINMFNDDGDPEQIKSNTFRPETVDYAPLREQIKSNAANSKRGAMTRARNAGTGVDYVNNSLAASSKIDRNLANHIINNYIQEKSTNAQIKNQAGKFNTQQSSMTDRYNARAKNYDRMQDSNRIRSSIAGIMEGGQGFARDINSANQYDKMAQALSNEGYVMAEDENGNLQLVLKKNTKQDE